MSVLDTIKTFFKSLFSKRTILLIVSKVIENDDTLCDDCKTNVLELIKKV